MVQVQGGKGVRKRELSYDVDKCLLEEGEG